MKKRRRRKLADAEFPREWDEILCANVWQFATLNADEQHRLRELVKIFAAEKRFEGCNGLELTDEIRVTIAAYACLLIMEIGIDAYGRVDTILVYPGEFLVPPGEEEDGLVSEDDEDRLGEAWHGGPVIVSWQDVRDAGRRRGGVNVAIHEFAHVLDIVSEGAAGLSPLYDRARIDRWHRILETEYDRLVAESESGRTTLIDDYGTSDVTEFFAVATECFFGKPEPLRKKHPLLYSMLAEYYRQDPATRC